MPSQPINGHAEVGSPSRDGRRLGLFVIWEKGRHQERRILSDLQSRFEVLEVYEMRWADSAKHSFARFYADIGVRGVYHVLSKGAGPFLVVTVADTSPQFEWRQTSRGLRLVNAAFFDAKLRYRRYKDAELGVHCSETRQELERDLMLLLGVSAERYLVETTPAGHGVIERRRCELAGAKGWASWRALFRVLNETVDYAVLEDPQPLHHGEEAGLRMVTSDCRALCRIVNARRSRQAELRGGVVAIDVGGEPVRPVIHFPGDGAYDARWCRYMLSSRTFDARGYYVAPAADRFWSRVYAALLWRDHYDEDGALRIAREAQSLGLNGDFSNAFAARELLNAFMRERGYAIMPRSSRDGPFASRIAARAGGSAFAGAGHRHELGPVHGLFESVSESYWTVRDEVLLHAPWVRALKRSLGVARGRVGRWSRSAEGR